MKVYQIEVFLNMSDTTPHMLCYEMFRHRDNAVAFLPVAVSMYRDVYELDQDADIHAVIEEYEVMDATSPAPKPNDRSWSDIRMDRFDYDYTDDWEY